MSLNVQLPNPYLTTGMLQLKANDSNESQKIIDFIDKTFQVDCSGQQSLPIHGQSPSISTHFSLNIQFPSSVQTQKDAFKYLKKWVNDRLQICEKNALNLIRMNRIFMISVVATIVIVGFLSFYPVLPTLTVLMTNAGYISLGMILTVISMKIVFHRTCKNSLSVRNYEKTLMCRFQIQLIAENGHFHNTIANVSNTAQRNGGQHNHQILIPSRMNRMMKIHKDYRNAHDSLHSRISLF